MSVDLKSLWLLSRGDRAIEVVKALAHGLGIGFPAAKALADSAPALLLAAAPAAEAQRLREALEAAGAQAEVRQADEAGPDTWDVELLDGGPTDLTVITTICERRGLKLAAAVDAVGRAPCLVAERLLRADAEDLQLALEAAGAIVALRPRVC